MTATKQGGCDRALVRKDMQWRQGTLLFLLLASGLGSAPGAVAGAFDKGTLHTTIIGGNGEAFEDNYFILGVGLGYYVLDGLEIGLDYQTWLGGDADIQKVSPSIRYVWDMDAALKPYVGTFYRRTFIEDFDDRDSYGYRAGLYMPAGRNLYIGVGLVYDTLRDCDESIYLSCSDTYTEFVFSFSL